MAFCVIWTVQKAPWCVWWPWWNPQAEMYWLNNKAVLYTTSITEALNSTYSVCWQTSEVGKVVPETWALQRKTSINLFEIHRQNVTTAYRQNSNPAELQWQEIITLESIILNLCSFIWASEFWVCKCADFMILWKMTQWCEATFQGSDD